MRRFLAPLTLSVAALALAACGSAAPATSSPSTAAGVLAAEPWVRTTDGSTMPDMTALFVSLTNPTSSDIRLISATCGNVAKKVELHEMATVDGKMVMRKVEGGIVVPKESHAHLAPGGPHVMLMGLTKPLPAGSEEIKCSLSFETGQKIDLVAPVKQFTEEQDTYHTHAPSDG